ncbi:MAG: GNAT family N-acetyltransferase [Candidatus Nanopelagicales bacterium]
MEPVPVVMRADDPRRADLEARGWHVTARSWGAQFDRSAVDSASLRDMVARVADVATVGELGVDDVSAVLALDAATWEDFPGGVATAHRPLTRERGTPGPSRRAFGARASGELVAMTFLDVADSRGETDFTTVAAPWRGRGLGTAVKAASVRTLVAEGLTQLRTGGSVDNGASVAMNRRVGYVLDEEWITMAPMAPSAKPSRRRS